MEHLSKKHLAGKPEAALLDLPEKELQFGTGVLLRGLSDYLIHEANRQGIFNGRVVVVKSTDQGDAGAFARQDNLYTVCTRGIENGQTVANNTISTAISRVLSANGEWEQVLACAANPLLGLVLSNTTEAGIQLVAEDVRQQPPASFPGKLLAFLYARYQVFSGNVGMGLVIVPTELVPNNGKQLESVIFELAHLNRLELPFIEWLENACVFCNSLVDRIVPGMPPAETASAIWTAIGYRDELLTVVEPYCFWAVEGNERIAAALSFHKASPTAMIVEPDIARYRERKLRLLNGTHTLACGLAQLANFPTVKDAMQDAKMAAFIEHLMLQEIAPAIPYPLPPGDAETFGRQVLDRFSNPFVEHRWLSIAAQYSSKMRARVVPLILEHYRKHQTPPKGIALAFAAFIAFYRQHLPVPDESAPYFHQLWETIGQPETIVREILANHNLWGEDLSALSGFSDAVTEAIRLLLEQGPRQTLHNYIAKIQPTKSPHQQFNNPTQHAFPRR